MISRVKVRGLKIERQEMDSSIMAKMDNLESATANKETWGHWGEFMEAEESELLTELMAGLAKSFLDTLFLREQEKGWLWRKAGKHQPLFFSCWIVQTYAVGSENTCRILIISNLRVYFCAV